MSKNTPKAKNKKQAGPKPAAEPAHGIGHNSGQVIPELVNLVTELLHLAEQKKAIGKAERDLRNRAKSEFGVLSGPLAHEMRLRKMDTDVRVQFESSHNDLKAALGYQAELDFVGGVPTNASLKQQPVEKDMPKNFTLSEDNEDADGMEPEETDEDAEEGANVITREG